MAWQVINIMVLGARSSTGPEKYRERGSSAPRKAGTCQEGKVIWADKSGRNEAWFPKIQEGKIGLQK